MFFKLTRYLCIVHSKIGSDQDVLWKLFVGSRPSLLGYPGPSFCTGPSPKAESMATSNNPDFSIYLQRVAESTLSPRHLVLVTTHHQDSIEKGDAHTYMPFSFPHCCEVISFCNLMRLSITHPTQQHSSCLCFF